MSNVFILGSGFTKDISNDKSPSLRQLGEEIKIKEIIPNSIREKYGYDEENFEVFVTKLTLDLSSNTIEGKEKVELDDIKRKIRQFIKERLARSELYDASNTSARKFIEGALKENDIIITLNYDCLLEYIMFRVCSSPKWSPCRGGYSNIGQSVYTPDEELPDNRALLSIKFYKLHGSLNFVEAMTLGRQGLTEEMTWIAPVLDQELGFTRERTEIVGSKIRGYFIEPSYIKIYHPMMVETIRRAALAIKDCGNITIIGCSIREEDWALKLLISFWGSQNAHIHIIDPTNADEIRRKITEIFIQRPSQIAEDRFKIYRGTMSEKIEEYLENYIG